MRALSVFGALAGVVIYGVQRAEFFRIGLEAGGGFLRSILEARVDAVHEEVICSALEALSHIQMRPLADGQSERAQLAEDLAQLEEQLGG